jgi:sec-independent protein translocase protein TatA
MLPRIGMLELVIVVVVLLLIFGVGRLGQLGRDLGEGIREFRRGLTGEEEDKSEEETGTEEA